MVYESLKDLFTGICDAIRNKDGSVGMIEHQDIPDRILELKSSSGGTAVGRDIRKGKSAYVNGELVEGAMSETSQLAISDTDFDIIISTHDPDQYGFMVQLPRERLVLADSYYSLHVSKPRFGNAKRENVDFGVQFTSAEGVCMTGTRPTTGGNSTDLSDIGKLHFWEKYNSNPVGGYVENEPSSTRLEVEIKVSVTTTHKPIYFGDTFEFDKESKEFNLDIIGNCTTAEAAQTKLPGKYIRYNTENGYLYYVHEDATFTESTVHNSYNGVTSRYISISKASKITAGVSEVIGYAAAEESETYPDNGEHTDGYWYVYRGFLADALSQVTE